MASALAVLADPARLRVISILAASASGESCVSDLSEVLGLSQPTVSHHLKVLQDAEVVSREQRGRWAYFRLRREPLKALAAAISPSVTYVPARQPVTSGGSPAMLMPAPPVTKL
jgi:ArsR family transcriptional regulator, arsenate/arsenite/antimonite-responsive transcriptional repressor